MKVLALITIMACGMLMGCNHQKQTKDVSLVDPARLNEDLISVNKRVVNIEDQQIRDYISRQGWRMNETGTGLRYLIYHKGNGPKPKQGEIVSFRYEIRLINGELIYSSNELGLKTFRVGSGGVESGLEEAVLLLSLGDKAKLVLPSHLAYGLLGDQNKVPGKASLIYDLELVEIKQEKQ
jgi:FKBP-type peptidyl-prolyl cis-trans isomerase